MTIRTGSTMKAALVLAAVFSNVVCAFGTDEHHGPHHASLFVGQTEIFEDGHSNLTGITLGLDYEYRLNERLGVGFVAERALGDIDANTLIGAFDIHFGEGWVVQTGPGIERIDGDTNWLGRLGLLYEYEFGAFTLSPQLHYDMTNKEDSIVFGVAFGTNF